MNSRKFIINATLCFYILCKSINSNAIENEDTSKTKKYAINLTCTLFWMQLSKSIKKENLKTLYGSISGVCMLLTLKYIIKDYFSDPDICTPRFNELTNSKLMENRLYPYIKERDQAIKYCVYGAFSYILYLIHTKNNSDNDMIEILMQNSKKITKFGIKLIS